jgi:F-type H+-transporting ATPase subunit delta
VLKGAVARRFAEAVMEIAVQQGTLERWLADVRLIGEAFGNRHLAFVLREPNIPFQRKELVVRDLLAGKVQHDALNLALVLVHDDLVEAGPRLAQEFERLYDDYRGQAKALVTTALPLDDAERAQVASDLERITGRRIILQERVDPSILGGVVARVGDTLIDGSVKRRLSLLRELIIKGGGPFGGTLGGGPGPDGGPGGGPGGGGPESGGPAGDVPQGDGTVPFVVEPRGNAGNGASRPSGPADAARRPDAGGAGGTQHGGQRNRRRAGRDRGRRR